MQEQETAEQMCVKSGRYALFHCKPVPQSEGQVKSCNGLLSEVHIPE